MTVAPQSARPCRRFDLSKLGLGHPTFDVLAERNLVMQELHQKKAKLNLDL
jgi:hypothetical protein